MIQTLKKYSATAMTLVTTLFMTAQTAAAQGLKNVDIRPGTGFATDFGDLVTAVLSFVMVIAALLVFIYLIWGGIQWITSGGDKSKTEEARNKITAAVVGLIVLAASYAILLIALNFLGFSDLNDVFQRTRTIPEAAQGG
jgi:hypothetical protein